MEEEKPKIDLSIYLAKETSPVLESLLKKPESLSQHPLDLGANSQAVLFVRRPQSNPPRWARFFHSHLEAEIFGLNSSTGAVLAIQVNERVFLLSFSQGWHNINSAKVISDFGLRTALNIIDPNSIRSIDKSSLEAEPKQLREQTGKASEIQNFGIDIERDLLRAVTGKPTDKAFGTRVSGLESLKLSLGISLQDLPELLIKLLTAFESDRYKTGPFAWIDHIGQVRDHEIRAQLNHDLVQKINAGDIDKIWLSVPQIIDWDRVTGFKYKRGKRQPRVYDVRIPEFLETFDGADISEADLMSRKILCVDENDFPVLERPAYYFLYAELVKDDHTFLLNNGSWYRVQDGFADTINRSFENTPQYARSLPDYDDNSEGEYNSRVAASAPNQYTLFDKDLVRIAGAASPVEVCDLFRTEKEFLHVKRYGGSSVLSHLFNQGLVSGELFQMDREYRNAVNTKLPADRQVSNPDTRPAQNEYKIVYAIVSESDDPLTIPFFSKVSLKHCITRLSAMGFSVELAKISVNEERKLRKLYQPQKTPRKAS